MKLGEQIRAARKARKATQAELAATVGITRQQLANIEAGRSGFATLNKLLDALSLTPTLSDRA